MLARQTLCLKRLGGDRAGELRVGRFFGNPRVTVGQIIAGWSTQTRTAVAGRHVLAIQDRSEVVINTTPRRRRGLGKVGKGTVFGLMVHAMLAVDAASGACLGLVGGDVWTRSGPAGKVYGRRLEARESIHWSRTAEQAQASLAQAERVTVVADREADIYALWASAAAHGFDLLVRANPDRRLSQDASLFATMDGFPVIDTRTITVASHQPGQPARRATLSLRIGTVTICRPRDPYHAHLPPTLRLHAIDVREMAPPPGVEPLHWRLLSTHDVADAAGAWQIVGWYQMRWIIEQLFRATKSQGLGLEDSQLGSAERLLKLAAAAVKVACIGIQLVQERDGKHGLDAAIVFDEAEITTLQRLIPTLQGKTARQQNPHPARTLAWAAWGIARLGGWNCYYRPPGPITMRRGTEQFQAIHRGHMLGLTLQRDVRIH